MIIGAVVILALTTLAELFREGGENFLVLVKRNNSQQFVNPLKRRLDLSLRKNVGPEIGVEFGDDNNNRRGAECGELQKMRYIGNTHVV